MNRVEYWCSHVEHWTNRKDVLVVYYESLKDNLDDNL